MNQECLCDISSSEVTGEKTEEEVEEQDKDSEYVKCNRIFLNFNQKFRNPGKESYNIAKVKDLFNYLSEREDLQEMKVSGWLEENNCEGIEKEEEEKEDDEEDEEGSFSDGNTPKKGGQRFVMSRDFWYRKLNILKAQKLDEAALEAKDIPPVDSQKDLKCMKWVKIEKVFSSQMKEKKKEVLDEINLFDESVAKPVEKILRKRFVNVYHNKKYFSKECN